MAQKPRGRADRIDAYVGARIRENRTLKGLSQEDLADASDISYQQVQKYERGANRVGASRLYYIGQVLGMPVSSFFTGLPPLDRDQDPAGREDETQQLSLDQPTRDRESLELMRSYHAVRDRGLKRKIYELVKAAGQV
ncbi:MAG: helix-turn-helix transcriptional regulator [Rhodospirillales bacterium]|nr:helix-turn-helix transcriptional regulator [Rhodospirillales bacterium]